MDLDRSKAKELLNEFENWDSCIAGLRMKFPNFPSSLVRNDFYRLEKAVALMLAGRNPDLEVISPESVFDVRGFQIDFEDEVLNRAIDHRCEKFIQAGLVEEVIQLIVQGDYDCSCAAEKSPEQSVGYLETFHFLKELWTAKMTFVSEESIDLFHNYLARYQINSRKLIKTQRKALRSLPVKPHLIKSTVDSLGCTPIDNHLAYIHKWAFALPEHFAEEAERLQAEPAKSEASGGLPYITVNKIFSDTGHGEHRVREALTNYMRLIEQHSDALAAAKLA